MVFQTNQFSIFSQFSVFKYTLEIRNNYIIQNVILGLARNTAGNAHVTSDQLFSDVDGYYSMCFAASRGNVRNFYQYCPSGRRLNTKVAQFRIKKRTEVAINWYRLTADGVIAVIGK